MIYTDRDLLNSQSGHFFVKNGNTGLNQ